jgi:multidrug transporter EmrE-like cation transporter
MVMTTLLGRFVYHERMDRIVYVFIAMILVGVVGLDLVVG